MKTEHPIVIRECPKCGAMQAARSPYLEPMKDEHGDPDPRLVYLMKIECLGCIEITPVPPPALSYRVKRGLDSPVVFPLFSQTIIGVTR